MELVMSGNLNAEVATTNSRDEISSLSRTFNNMVNEISHLINEIQVTQKRESELRFEMLLAQLNPHFLFNTLNSIKWMSVISGTF
uniref:sensor histidine kinase n=1 Tax=Enterocloster clostridioformis TaxID=1531 RepID=UPI00080C4DD0|nr:histidine kinase [Enterocloster clostridioformis]